MKIALIGYGKMGKELEKVALSRGHEIVCIIDINFNALAQPLVLFQEQIRRLITIITKFTKRL